MEVVRCAKRRNGAVYGRDSLFDRPNSSEPHLPRLEHEETLIVSPERRTSSPALQLALMGHAGLRSSLDEDDASGAPDGGPLVGPVDALPVLTPHCSFYGDRWSMDFTLMALLAILGTVSVWPVLIDRPAWERGKRSRIHFSWNWLRFDTDGQYRMPIVGCSALDTLMAACLHHPGYIREVISAGHYIRVPYLLIGPDKKADFPVLYRAFDCVVLHTMGRSQDDLKYLRECRMVVRR